MRRSGSRDHLEVARARSFGASADAYDRGRPGLPSAIVDLLVPRGDESVLDVGCGTGKAAVAIAARGCTVLGVEPDAAMAEVARRHGIDVEITDFESWDPADRHFDLIVAAQSWHWIDPVSGPAKAASSLVDGGRLSPVSNYRSVADPEVETVIASVYRSLEPDLLDTSPILGGVAADPEIARHCALLASSGRFGDPTVERVQWTTSLDVGGWLDLTRSQSDHVALGPSRFAALLDGVAGALEPFGRVALAYETVAILVTKAS